MSDCEHKWASRGSGNIEVVCVKCNELRFRKCELIEELLSLQADIQTMHELKEKYRVDAEKAEARVKELKGDFEQFKFLVRRNCGKDRLREVQCDFNEWEEENKS